MTDEPTQSLLSILTAEPWTYDGDRCFISFHPGGTGQIWAVAEFSPCLGAAFDWKCHDPEALNHSFDATANMYKFSMETTLTTRPVALFYAADQRKITPERTLENGAFQPKQFTINLEKGIFPTPVCAKNPKAYPYTHKYALRLRFDQSPYPPPEEGTNAWRSTASSLEVWKWTEFGSRDLGPYSTSWLETCTVM